MIHFLKKIDFKELKRQKQTLLVSIGKAKTKKQAEDLNGILQLIDAIQDEAVDKYGYSAKKVFIEETFVVFVKRTITSYRNVEVKAKTKKEAQQKALDLAPDLEFGEIETEHETNGVLTETEHKNLFI